MQIHFLLSPDIHISTFPRANYWQCAHISICIYSKQQIFKYLLTWPSAPICSAFANFVPISSPNLWISSAFCFASSDNSSWVSFNFRFAASVRRSQSAIKLSRWSKAWKNTNGYGQQGVHMHKKPEYWILRKKYIAYIRISEQLWHFYWHFYDFSHFN